MNYRNTIRVMFLESDTVYVDGFIVKNRYGHPTHPNKYKVLENLDDYFIISFNRDIKNGERYLELSSENHIS